MKKRWLCAAAVLCLLCGLLSGCQKEKPKDDEIEMDIGTDVQLIHIDLKTVFSLDEMSEMLGVTVTGNNVFESDTSVSYQDENAGTVAIIAFQECTREAFDETVAVYEELEETPNLGEIAYWASVGELLVYDSGYAVSVHVAVEGMTESEQLTASRQLAALLFERSFA